MVNRRAAARARGETARAAIAQTEGRINVLVATALEGAAGQEFVDWLRSITIETVYDGTVSPDRLMHREGARWLVAEIERRRALGMTARITNPNGESS